jgi:hypothetical protein
MRITDDRYRREQRRLDLAMGMIRHEARTATIRSWTGLTADRIRKLHRQYVLEGDALAKRHRGKPPRQSSFFLRNADLRRQSAALGGLFALLGLLRAEPVAARRNGTPPWVELFCEAYETYLDLGLGNDITFEHGAYLLEALQDGADLRPGSCPVCKAFTIIDTQRRMPPHCSLCEDAARSQLMADEPRNTANTPQSSRRARIRKKRSHAKKSASRVRRPLSRS